ncbi:hypothetical protein CEXT_400481 [Caerostris extrusa]|uniref:Uncharacterized protein n=1 Tax=Caerostris extrusa TaxID=172846 RepID=A0AAV4Q954_CAEEX|nr:hypothetical protein CEXT_400481 [Caerostris extrusa]
MKWQCEEKVLQPVPTNAEWFLSLFIRIALYQRIAVFLIKNEMFELDFLSFHDSFPYPYNSSFHTTQCLVRESFHIRPSSHLHSGVFEERREKLQTISCFRFCPFHMPPLPCLYLLLLLVA